MCLQHPPPHRFISTCNQNLQPRSQLSRQQLKLPLFLMFVNATPMRSCKALCYIRITIRLLNSRFPQTQTMSTLKAPCSTQLTLDCLGLASLCVWTLGSTIKTTGMGITTIPIGMKLDGNQLMRDLASLIKTLRTHTTGLIIIITATTLIPRIKTTGMTHLQITLKTAQVATATANNRLTRSTQPTTSVNMFQKNTLSPNTNSTA